MPRRPRRCPLAALSAAALLTLGAAHAAPGSPECRQALAELRASEDALIAAPADAQRRAAMRVQRSTAARLCLGEAAGEAAPPPPRRRAPEAVPPVSMGLGDALQAARPAPANAAAPLPRPAAPATVTGCDAVGCWASDGTRLQRAGPLLVGPRGACQTQGPLLLCP